MKLYNAMPAPNPTKVRVYLAEKGIEVPLVEVDIARGETRSPEFRAKNPLGQVPVLELDDGTCYTDSLAIIEYFEELHPNPPMFGSSPEERMRVRALERICDLGVLGNVSRYLHHSVPFFARLFEQIPEVASYSLRAAHSRLKHLDGILADRPFVAGERPTVADCSLYAGLRFAHNVRSPLDISARPNLTRWWTEFEQRPSGRA